MANTKKVDVRVTTIGRVAASIDCPGFFALVQVATTAASRMEYKE